MNRHNICKLIINCKDKELREFRKWIYYRKIEVNNK